MLLAKSDDPRCKKISGSGFRRAQNRIRTSHAVYNAVSDLARTEE